jgi:hypothetical protein
VASHRTKVETLPLETSPPLIGGYLYRAECECGWYSTWRERRGSALWAGFLHRQHSEEKHNG